MQVAEAFAGYSPGEADGLRRAMSRKRSGEMMQRHRERFLEGASATAGRRRRRAERVWGMVEGFAGFGFPKAHSAAFGLLAYQSTWLRVHYGPEFLCALLNEQPMGFYAPDSLVHEAQNRGIAVLGLDVNASDVECTVQHGAVRLGLGYVKGATAAEMAGLVAERGRGGPLRTISASWPRARAEAGDARATRLVGRLRRAPRRAPTAAALWQLGLTALAAGAGGAPARGRPRRAAQARQLALPLELPAAPRAAPARPLAAADRRLLDQRGDDRRPRDGRPARAPDRAQARHQRPAGPPAERLRGRPGRAGDRQAAAGDGGRNDVPAVRGRVRDGQPDRPQGGLRAPAPPGPGRAAAAGQGPARAHPGAGAEDRLEDPASCPTASSARPTGSRSARSST